MSEQEKLELKEALRVALGWKLRNYETDRYAKTDDDISDAYTNDGWTLEGWDERREAWQWDPMTPDVSIPTLREYCKARNYGWRIEETDIVRVFIFRRGQITRNGLLTVAFEKGDDVSPCIARAIVASRKEEWV